MGYAYGQNNNGREIGYGVEATCDWPGCEEKIDRGVGQCCGGDDGVRHAGESGRNYCGGYFCEGHMDFDVCLNCVRPCPDCEGTGKDDEAEDGMCARCDSFGSLGHEQPEPAEGYEPKDAADLARMP